MFCYKTEFYTFMLKSPYSLLTRYNQINETTKDDWIQRLCSSSFNWNYYVLSLFPTMNCYIWWNFMALNDLFCRCLFKPSFTQFIKRKLFIDTHSSMQRLVIQLSIYLSFHIFIWNICSLTGLSKWFTINSFDE